MKRNKLVVIAVLVFCLLISTVACVDGGDVVSSIDGTLDDINDATEDIQAKVATAVANGPCDLSDEVGGLLTGAADGAFENGVAADAIDQVFGK